MGRDHLKVSEKREAWKLKVEQILRKTILLTSLHPKHKVTLELGAYGSGRVVSTATQNVKMSSIPDYIDSNQYPSSLKGPAKEEAYSFPGKKKKNYIFVSIVILKNILMHTKEQTQQHPVKNQSNPWSQTQKWNRRWKMAFGKFNSTN